jgi:hypothetical protein
VHQLDDSAAPFLRQVVSLCPRRLFGRDDCFTLRVRDVDAEPFRDADAELSRDGERVGILQVEAL